MLIRLIAIDLDGTLLHDDMTISDYSRKVIRKAMERGYEIVVATGRMWDSARKKAEILKLGNVPLICYTGAWIMMSETGEPVRQDGLSPDLASEILLESKRRGWNATSFMDDMIYMDRPNGTEEKYQKYRSKKPVYIGENFYHPQQPVTRIVLADPSLEKRLAIRKVVEEKFKDQVDVVFPGDDFVDIHKKGVNKAAAVRFLCEKKGIRAYEIMAFGNTENDVPLLKMAGFSYAVSNADEVAKKAARFRCPSNEEDGVARTIEEKLL